MHKIVYNIIQYIHHYGLATRPTNIGKILLPPSTFWASMKKNGWSASNIGLGVGRAAKVANIKPVQKI